MKEKFCLHILNQIILAARADIVPHYLYSISICPLVDLLTLHNFLLWLIRSRKLFVRDYEAVVFQFHSCLLLIIN